MSKQTRIKASASRGKKEVTKSSPAASSGNGNDSKPKLKKKVSPNPVCPKAICRHIRKGHCSLGLHFSGHCNYLKWPAPRF